MYCRYTCRWANNYRKGAFKSNGMRKRQTRYMCKSDIQIYGILYVYVVIGKRIVTSRM